MPGNTITINGSEGLTWYVGDSKMDELMEFLHKIGIHQHEDLSLYYEMMPYRQRANQNIDEEQSNE